MGPPSVLEQLSRTGVEIKVIPEEHSSKGIVNKILCIAELLGETNSAKNILNNEITPKIYELERFQRILKAKIST
jgi:ABC-type hemin transport system substrate-binding protein